MLGRVGSRVAELWPGHDVTASLDADERIKDCVQAHGVVLVVPVLVGFLGLAMALAPGWPRLADVVGVGLLAWALWKALRRSVDRFVITNHRVFRVRGVLRRSRASMPIRRVLDITVHKPLFGLLLGYGHFVFESAAQEQGLREIRFVGNPDDRERTIQQLIHPPRSAEPRAAVMHCPGCRCFEAQGGLDAAGGTSGRWPATGEMSAYSWDTGSDS